MYHGVSFGKIKLCKNTLCSWRCKSFLFILFSLFVCLFAILIQYYIGTVLITLHTEWARLYLRTKPWLLNIPGFGVWKRRSRLGDASSYGRSD
jgi:hypothetical protein